VASDSIGDAIDQNEEAYQLSYIRRITANSTKTEYITDTV